MWWAVALKKQSPQLSRSLQFWQYFLLKESFETFFFFFFFTSLGFWKAKQFVVLTYFLEGRGALESHIEPVPHTWRTAFILIIMPCTLWSLKACWDGTYCIFYYLINMLEVACITGYIFCSCHAWSFTVGNYLPILNPNHFKVANMLLCQRSTVTDH